MLLTLHSQNRSSASTDVDTAAHFTNVFNENIVLPRDCKIGVVSLSVNINGDVVIDGSNNSFTAELGSSTLTCSIANGTYKIQDQSAGTDPSTITYPLIAAIQTALTNAIAAANMTSLFPVADNVIRGIKLDNGVGCQIDLAPTSSKTSTAVALTDSNLKATGLDTPLSNYGGEIQVNTFGTNAASAGFGDSGGYFVLDCSGEFAEGSASRISRYGQGIFRLGSSQGVKYFVGFFKSTNSINFTPKEFCGFQVDTDNSIVIIETDSAGSNRFTAQATGITNTGSGDIMLRISLAATAGGRGDPIRTPQYYISTDAGATFRGIDMSSISQADRKTYRSTARIQVGAAFVTGMTSRPALASLTSTSGEWTISTPGSGLSTGVSTMASTTSANGVITGGSINISAVGGSGEATAFNMTGAALPDRSAAGDFTTGDTITLTNGVVITKSAATLTTDRVKPNLKQVRANVVDDPTRNPLLPNLDPHIVFPQALADILDVPRKNVGSDKDGTLHITSRSPLNADRHQPEIYISSPTLPINSRTNKISHNTLSRVPVGLSDNVGQQTGFHFHEVFNVIYHRLFNSQEQTLSQIEVRLTDREGADISSLLHPSTLTLHVDAR